MSKTDNTRPLALQWADQMVPGFVSHGRRIAYHFGGEKHPGTKQECHARRRRIRAREQQALQQALRQPNYEFDLPPIREDARRIQWDLS